MSGQVWIRTWRCVRCKRSIVHVEVSPDDDDESHGRAPSLVLGCPSCGGKLRVERVTHERLA